MTLSIASSIASESLGTISNQIGVVSRNISGAGASGYSAKIAQVVTSESGAARVVEIRRATDARLLKNLLHATAGSAESDALSDGLSQIERLMNISSGSAADLSTGSSPAAAIAGFKAAMQQLGASPSNAAAADAAISAARGVTQSLKDATAATQDVRRLADRGIQSSVEAINRLLEEFQQVNNDVISGAAAKIDITDKLDKRDGLLASLASEIGISTFVRPNNDMVIYTDSGVTLFESTPRKVEFQTSVSLAAGIAGGAVSIDGVPVTGAPSAALNIHSGRLVGLTRLRDVIAPTFQSQLDEIARGLVASFSEADRFNTAAPSAPGLFTYPGASTTPGPQMIPGLAGAITINPNVDPLQGGDVMRLRDGGISSPGNPAFVYNDSEAAGYSDRIQELIYSLSAPQPFDAAAGNGASASVTAFAASSLGWLASQRQQIDNASTYQTAMLNQSAQALSNATGVSLDDQMSKMLALENSYQASAKLLAVVNSMYTTLFDAIRL